MKKVTSVSDLTSSTDESKVVPMTHTQTAGQTASTDTYSVSFTHKGNLVSYSNLNLATVRFIVQGRRFADYDLVVSNDTTWEVLRTRELQELGAIAV